MTKNIRRLRTLAVVFLTAACTLVTEPADATVPRTVEISADFYDPGQPAFTYYGAECDPVLPGVCRVKFGGRVEWFGGLSGTSTYDAIGYQEGTGPSTWEVRETFTGTVAGCGTGQFEWYGKGEIDFAAIDLATQEVPMEGVLDFVGPGAGDLTGIDGALEATARLRLFPAFGEQHGHVTGTVTCH
ncbi:MAG TPA: hypothetical protein VNB24_03640 [Acidimicrobiales bacterium]|nr:hypothetical protein [Acidimicrobiales bacterium]